MESLQYKQRQSIKRSMKQGVVYITTHDSWMETPGIKHLKIIESRFMLVNYSYLWCSLVIIVMFAGWYGWYLQNKNEILSIVAKIMSPSALINVVSCQNKWLVVITSQTNQPITDINRSYKLEGRITRKMNTRLEWRDWYIMAEGQDICHSKKNLYQSLVYVSMCNTSIEHPYTEASQNPPTFSSTLLPQMYKITAHTKK